MRIQTVLEQLGYSTNQVSMYLACLKMGPATITQIADRVNLPRTTATETAEEMQRRGLLTYFLKRNRKYWTAEPPTNLTHILQHQQEALAEIMPLLQTMGIHSNGNDPHIRCFIGNSEIKQIFTDIITTQHHIKSLANWDDVVELFGKNFIQEFINNRKAKFLDMQLITKKSSITEDLKQQDGNDRRHTRFLPEHVSLRKIINYMYGQKTAIIALAKKMPVGIIIEDSDVTNTMTLYYEALWRYCIEA